MTFWGTTATGDKLLLGQPTEATLSFDRDAPADLLRAKFPADSLWEELAEVTLYRDEDPVFCGVVDEQNTVLSADGLTVELVCRSREALLLDNEAPPRSISGPSLELLEARLLLPLGLTLGEGDREKKLGELPVSKGESCWTVLERFCRTWLGTRPYVDLNGAVQCGGLPGSRVELKDVLSAQVSLLPCKRIGQVWKQSCLGEYDTLYKSARPAKRLRYVSLQSGKDARELLRQGERDSFLLTVTCAGAWWPGRNDTVSVTLPRVGRFENCPVRSVQYRLDKSGQRTRLVLEKAEEESACGSQNS